MLDIDADFPISHDFEKDRQEEAYYLEIFPTAIEASYRRLMEGFNSNSEVEVNEERISLSKTSLDMLQALRDRDPILLKSWKEVMLKLDHTSLYEKEDSIAYRAYYRAHREVTRFVFDALIHSNRIPALEELQERIEPKPDYDMREEYLRKE